MDPKTAEWAKKAAEKDGKWPADKLAKAKKLAEKLKGATGIDNPHALARWQTAKAGGKEG